MAGYDLIFRQNSDDSIIVEQLKNTLTGALVTGATVEATVLDEADMPVAGIPSPVTLTEQTSPVGTYIGNVPDTASLSDGDTGNVVVTADAGAGLHREWTLSYIVQSK